MTVIKMSRPVCGSQVVVNPGAGLQVPETGGRGQPGPSASGARTGGPSLPGSSPSSPSPSWPGRPHREVVRPPPGACFAPRSLPWWEAGRQRRLGAPEAWWRQPELPRRRPPGLQTALAPTRLASALCSQPGASVVLKRLTVSPRDLHSLPATVPTRCPPLSSALVVSSLCPGRLCQRSLSRAAASCAVGGC